MSTLLWLIVHLFMVFTIFDPSPLTVCINCSFLWPPYVTGQAIIFLPVVSIVFFFFFVFFYHFSSSNLSGHILNVYIQCDPTANLECRSEMCCSRLAANTGRKKNVAKNRYLGTIAQLRRAVSSQLRRVSTIGKNNLLSSNISSACPHNMVNFGQLASEILCQFGTPLQISTGFLSWKRYCTALQQWASAKLCGVEQRAPPTFGKAANTLGIGPHFQLHVCLLFYYQI